MNLPDSPKDQALRTRKRIGLQDPSNHSAERPASGDRPGGATARSKVTTLRRRTAVLSFMVLTLAACSTSAPIRYYSIEPAAPLGSGGAAAPSAAAYDGPPLQVHAVRLPAANDRLELTREIGAGEWQIRDFDHWIAPLDRLARQALSEDLAARLPPGRLVFPGAAYPRSGAYLTVDILSFESRDGVARMALSYTLRERAGAQTPEGTPKRRGAQLRLQTNVGEGADRIPRAWSVLLGQLADHVAARLEGGDSAGDVATR